MSWAAGPRYAGNAPVRPGRVVVRSQKTRIRRPFSRRAYGPARRRTRLRGFNNDFRDEPFAFTWGLTPPLFHTDTDAWLLLRDEQELLLSHRVYRDGAWTENGRTGALFGGDVRLLGDFGGNGERMTVELYVNDSNVDIGLTLNRSGEDWFLSSVRLTEYGQDDSYGATLLYDRLFSPADGGLTLTEDGQMRFLPLSEACETELTRLDAGALLTLCRQAYGDAGLMW